MERQHGTLSQRSPQSVAAAQSLAHAVANTLRTAVQVQVQAHGRRDRVSPAQWRHALRLVCEDARRSKVPIEQLLVALKQTLVPLCDVFGVARGDERTVFVSRLVTICIEEFYRLGERTLAAEQTPLPDTTCGSR